MDIVYSSSDSYCEIAGISILSLLEHNRNVKELNLYLIDNQISAENKQKLEGMIASFGRTLTYLAHPDIEKRSATEINVGRWNISTFYRLFLPSMLPETVKKVLFIDCDTLVMQDLTPLWEMDMGDKWLYGVDDCRGAAYRTNLGLQPTDNYINNGVLLVDLDAWRKNNVEDMFLRYIRENQGDITFVDQGVQNGVLSKLGRSGILHPKYNCMTVFFAFDYKNLIKLRKPPVPGRPRAVPGSGGESGDCPLPVVLSHEHPPVGGGLQAPVCQDVSGIQGEKPVEGYADEARRPHRAAEGAQCRHERHAGGADGGLHLFRAHQDLPAGEESETEDEPKMSR